LIFTTTTFFWWVWFVMWLLPMATWLPLVTRIRNIAEHALVEALPARHPARSGKGKAS